MNTNQPRLSILFNDLLNLTGLLGTNTPAYLPGDEETKFYSTETWVNVIKRFTAEIYEFS